MNFFELWLGNSPDGGSGSLEICAILAILGIICVTALRNKIARSTSGGHRRSRTASAFGQD
jgi:hypothetical protein